MKEGEENTVRIKFRANPEPSEGAWKIGEISVPVAAASIDNAFASSGFLKGVSRFFWPLKAKIFT